MGGDMDNARRITCAIAIHNAQSVSRVQKLKRHSETETSLAQLLTLHEWFVTALSGHIILIWVRVISIVLSVLM